MRRGRTFVEVLDEQLAGRGCDERPAPPPSPPASGSTSFFLFDRGFDAVRASAGSQFYRTAGGTAPVAPPRSPRFVETGPARVGGPEGARVAGSTNESRDVQGRAHPDRLRVVGASRPSPPSGQSRLIRAFSPEQQRALLAFRHLGAAIGSDFTPDELRSAFRALAHRYHPDRHPSSSEREKAALSAHFAQVREAYRTLQAVAA